MSDKKNSFDWTSLTPTPLRRTGWDKLRDVVIAVMADSTNVSTSVSTNANRVKNDHIWAKVRHDPDILVELIGYRYTSMIEDAIKKIMENLDSEVSRNKPSVSETEERATKVYRARKDAARRTVENVRSIADARVQRANTSLFSTIQSAANDFAAAKVEEYKKSVLFKFHINGRPIGESSASEVAAWKDTQSDHIAFVGALIQGISVGDNRPLKDIVSPGEADVLWQSTHQRFFGDGSRTLPNV